MVSSARDTLRVPDSTLQSLRVAIVIGGACATEELLPGVRFSSAAVVLSLFWPKIARELDLQRHGFAYYRTRVDRVGIWENGRVLMLRPELDRQLRALESFSRRDAVGLVRLGVEIRRFAALYEPTVLGPPPSLDAFHSHFRGHDERVFERIVLGSTPGPLRQAVSGLFTPIAACSNPGTAE